MPVKRVIFPQDKPFTTTLLVLWQHHKMTFSPQSSSMKGNAEVEQFVD
jgi:hypothetical protein